MAQVENIDSTNGIISVSINYAHVVEDDLITYSQLDIDNHSIIHDFDEFEDCRDMFEWNPRPAYHDFFFLCDDNIEGNITSIYGSETPTKHQSSHTWWSGSFIPMFSHI